MTASSRCSHLRTGSCASTIAAILLFGSIALRAQDVDPYAIEPEDRYTASLPVAAGLIINVSYPVLSLDLGDRVFVVEEPTFFDKLWLDGHIYYDAWQVGVLHRSYGDLAELTFRSINRDAYSGWGLQYGKQNFQQRTSADSLRDFSRTLYAFNLIVSGGHQPGVGFFYQYGMTLGYADGDPATLPNSSETIDIDPGLLYMIYGSAGARIPMGLSGVTLGAEGVFGYQPPNSVAIDDLIMTLEFRLFTRIGLGLNL